MPDFLYRLSFYANSLTQLAITGVCQFGVKPAIAQSCYGRRNTLARTLKMPNFEEFESGLLVNLLHFLPQNVCSTVWQKTRSAVP